MNSEPSDQKEKSSGIIRSLKIAFVYTLIVLICVLYFKDPIFQKIDEFLEHADKHISFLFCIKVMLSFLMCHIVNAFSWMILLQNKGEYALIANLKAASVYSMLINVLPIGTGHMIGVWYFYKFLNCTTKKLIFAWSLDQYIRGLVKVSSLILFLSIVEPFGEVGVQMRKALLYFGSLILLGAIALILFRHSNKIKELSKKLLDKFGFKEESVFQKKWLKTFFTATLLRIVCWFFECLPVYFICSEILGEFSLELVIVLFLSVKMATAYSISPGNFGVHEGVAYFIATAYGVESHDALSIGIIYHLGFWIPTVIPGFILVILQQIRKKAQ